MVSVWTGLVMASRSERGKVLGWGAALEWRTEKKWGPARAQKSGYLLAETWVHTSGRQWAPAWAAWALTSALGSAFQLALPLA